MHVSDTSENLQEKIDLLLKKYRQDGQDAGVYLDGMRITEYLNYWDYIGLGTLLNLQKTKTNYPDELVFLTYHQISELYFKLILSEIKQACQSATTEAQFSDKLSRINRYIQLLINSFEVLTEGLSRSQFMEFRNALFPASGFQSYQFRKIEMACTELKNLQDHTGKKNAHTPEELYENIYWKKGAIDEKTGVKSLTLTQFEAKYDKKLKRKAQKYAANNLWQVYISGYSRSPLKDEIAEKLKQIDANLNLHWRLVHYKSAIRHLLRAGADPGTGGTNWKKYLPPHFQRIIFYPELWTYEEMEDWGKSWLNKEIFSKDEEQMLDIMLHDGDYY